MRLSVQLPALLNFSNSDQMLYRATDAGQNNPARTPQKTRRRLTKKLSIYEHL